MSRPPEKFDDRESIQQIRDAYDEIQKELADLKNEVMALRKLVGEEVRNNQSSLTLVVFGKPGNDDNLLYRVDSLEREMLKNIKAVGNLNQLGLSNLKGLLSSHEESIGRMQDLQRRHSDAINACERRAGVSETAFSDERDSQKD